jgi:hypothetical protein
LSGPRKKIRYALVLIDDAPFKSAAWSDLHAARKRQEKAARDLHRHEEIDRPAYDAWLHRTFPTLITRLRELHEEVFAKGQRVAAVQAMSEYTGRPARKLWREQKEREANPERFEDEERAQREAERDAGFNADDEFFRDEADDFGSHARDRDPWEDLFGLGRGARPKPNPTEAARDVYRRLVLRLHPVRGGVWTAARTRLWHEVQQAWAAADADWLTRLEVEWEAANDVLSPNSPLGRLFRAVEELHAARRDIERKLREYRASAQWRFTLTLKKRDLLRRRTEMYFQHDIAFLQRQLAYLNATIASWEAAPRPRRPARARNIEVRFCE